MALLLDRCQALGSQSKKVACRVTNKHPVKALVLEEKLLNMASNEDLIEYCIRNGYPHHSERDFRIARTAMWLDELMLDFEVRAKMAYELRKHWKSVRLVEESLRFLKFLWNIFTLITSWKFIFVAWIIGVLVFNGLPLLIHRWNVASTGKRS